jgi:MFS family permease
VVAAFGVSYAEMGALLAVATMTGSLLQLLAGPLARVPSRVLLLGQNVGSSAGALLGAVAPGIAVFFAGRLVQGWSTWPQHPVGAAFLSRRHPGHRGSVLSWHVTAGNMGTLVAPLAMTAVIGAGGWRWGFVFLAAALASTAVVVALGMPGPWRRGPAGPDQPRVTLRGSWAEFTALVRQRPVAALLAAGMIAAGGQGIGILSVYLPAYLKTGLGFSPGTLGAVMTVVYAGAVIGPVLMGSVSDRGGHRGALLANYLLGAGALLLVPAAGSGAVALAVVGLAVGVFSYSELSLRQTVFADYLDDGAQRAGFGVFFALSQAVGALWVAVIGEIVTSAGFHAAFYAMAATFAAAAAVVGLGTWRRRQAPPAALSSGS